MVIGGDWWWWMVTRGDWWWFIGISAAQLSWWIIKKKNEIKARRVKEKQLRILFRGLNSSPWFWHGIISVHHFKPATPIPIRPSVAHHCGGTIASCQISRAYLFHSHQYDHSSDIIYSYIQIKQGRMNVWSILYMSLWLHLVATYMCGFWVCLKWIEMVYTPMGQMQLGIPRDFGLV